MKWILLALALLCFASRVEAAIAPTLLTSGNATTSVASYNTASITPASNKLILLFFVANRDDSGDPIVSSITGNGLTWAFVDSGLYSTGGDRRQTIFVYRALGTASAGAVTIAFTQALYQGLVWAVVQVDGTDITGTNGSGAIVQTAKDLRNNTADNNISITLSAFGDATNNAVIVIFSTKSTSDTPSLEGTYTSLATMNNTTSAISTRVGWFLGQDTTVAGTVVAQGNRGGIALEIKAAGGGGGGGSAVAHRRIQ